MQASTHDHKLSYRLLATVQCRMPQPRPTRTLSTSTATCQQKHHSLSFPSATFKDCMASFRCDMNSGPNDQTTAEDSTRETCCCLVLCNVTPYMTTVPVKLCTQTVIYVHVDIARLHCSMA